MRWPSEETIKTALQSLPSSLDETYERIFASIPEDDYPLLRTTISWIHLNGQIKKPITIRVKTNLNTKALIQLVYRQSTPSIILNDSTEPDDSLEYYSDLLQDVCGCLMTVNEGNVLLDRKSVV